MIKKGDVIQRGPTSWEVLGVDKDGRLFCRSANKNTAWITAEFHPEGQTTPEDSPVCICHDRGEGFAHDEESGMYVHSVCKKPTATHLAHMAARSGMEPW